MYCGNRRGHSGPRSKWGHEPLQTPVATCETITFVRPKVKKGHISTTIRSPTKPHANETILNYALWLERLNEAVVM